MEVTGALVRRFIYANYIANTIAAYLFIGGFPVPAVGNTLFWCSIGGLLVNATAHAWMIGGRGHIGAARIIMIGAPVTLLGAIWFTGMVTSPFLLVLALPLMSVHFISYKPAITKRVGWVYSVAYMAAAAGWCYGAGRTVSWVPAEYPLFTAMVIGMQGLGFLSCAYLSMSLPDPLMERLSKQEAELRDQQRKAELGTSLSVISHEVRTPLSVIGMNAELLARDVRGISDPERRLAGRIEDIRGAVKHIDELLRLVLSYAHERRGTYDRKPCEAASIVGKAVDLARMKYRRERASFVIESGSEERTAVFCDETAVFHVLVNLLDNAIKARIAGKDVRVGILLSREADMLVLAVKDNGSGISAEKLPRIFERFYTDGSGGTGIGLFVCKTVIEDHGGTIEAASEVGQGATFLIRLPLGGAPTAAQAKSPFEVVPTGRAGKREA